MQLGPASCSHSSREFSCFPVDNAQATNAIAMQRRVCMVCIVKPATGLYSHTCDSVSDQDDAATVDAMAASSAHAYMHA